MRPSPQAVGSLWLMILALRVAASSGRAPTPEGPCDGSGRCRTGPASDHLLLQVKGAEVRAHRQNSSSSGVLPSCARVLVIGDYGTRDNRQAKVAAALADVAASVDPVSIHAVGDNIYGDGAEGDPRLIVRWWREVYLRHRSLRRPWYVITGNHDWHTDARTERDFTSHPENTGGWWRMPNFWYKTRHATSSGLTVDMFHIDTSVYRGSSKPRQILGHGAKQEQISWLEAELQSSTADWKVALGHHPVYSAGSHGITLEILDEVDPVLRRFGVPVYIAGHDHSKHVMQHAGMTYIVSGAGGAIHRDRSDQYPPGSLKSFYPDNGFVGLSFCDRSSATLTIYDDGGRQQEVMTLANQPPEQRPFNPHPPVPVPCGSVMLKDVDRMCSMDGCTVLADQMSRKTCAEYCADNGLNCRGGWEEIGDSCIPTRSLGCHRSYGSTSDLLCRCEPGSAPTCRGAQLTDVKRRCSSDGCRVLARTGRRTCGEYCGAHGLTCRGAWEEKSDSCTEQKTLSCGERFSTSDLLCECA